MTLIDVREGWPELPQSAEAWLDQLDGPTAVRVPGRDPSRFRVVSGLLHGNEPSGLRAIFDVLRRREEPATGVLFFIGAVEAARHGEVLSHRMIPGRRDLNRCFRAPFAEKDGRIAQVALALMEEEGLEAVVDLHNNTGHNPAYGVGIAADPGRLGLASFFARRFVTSSFALGALHEAFPAHLPAATIECGRAGDPAADALAIAGLTRFLATDHLPLGARGEFQVLVDPVRVCMRSDTTLRFADHHDADVDLTMAPDVDRHNFQRIDAGTRVGWVKDATLPVAAVREDGEDVTEHLFELRGTELVTRVSVVPIMMTTNATVAAIDCLFYAAREG